MADWLAGSLPSRLGSLAKEPSNKPLHWATERARRTAERTSRPRSECDVDMNSAQQRFLLGRCRFGLQEEI